MSGLEHHARADGLVDLTMTSPAGQRITITVSESYAKSRAWSILADLDPDEAAQAATSTRGARRTPRTELTQSERALLAVSHGCKTVAEIKARTGLKSSSIAGRLSELKDRDLVWQTTGGGGRGIRATYDVSTKGQLAAKQMQASAA